jgi:pimeloyl-ACP methyl ester carboxylesterase
MRWLLLLLLLAPLPGLAADEAAHARFFSARSIPVALPSTGLAISFTQHYRGAVPHAAFAFAQGTDGRAAWSLVSGHDSPESAQRQALANCNRQLTRMRGEGVGSPCRILAVDGDLRGPAGEPQAGAPAIVPERGGIGPFTRSPFHLHRGPRAAEGAVIWAHGYGGAEEDHRHHALPGLVSPLNEAGFDVFRFDRHPGDDSLFITLPRLVRALPALREAGYRRIILGGQSRGAWQAMLAAAERPELVDAVLAAAPAAHGERPEFRPLALEDFRRVLAGLDEQRTRLLVMLFDRDEFDPSPEERGQMVASLAQRRAVPTLALWATGPARGHSGVSDWRFTRDYAGCVITLVQAPPSAAPRGLRREGCGGG